MSTLRTNEVEMLDGRGKGAITFDSVEELQNSASVKVGQKVRTLGYYAPGDGGGNDYKIVAAGTGTDDGGSYIDLAGSGHQAEGLFGSTLNVKQFGAIANGSTDDSSAIQAAIDFTDDGDYTVNFPPGDYAISSTINLVDFSTRLTGSGHRIDDDLQRQSTRLIWTGADNGRMVELNANNEPTRWGYIVENMVLDGAFTTGVICLYSQSGTNRVSLRDLTTDRCDSGVIIEESCFGWDFQNCYFHNHTTYGVLYEEDCNNANFFNCNWSNTGTLGTEPAAHLRANRTNNGQDLNLFGCNFQAPTPPTFHIDIQQCLGVCISGGYFEQNAAHSGDSYFVRLGESSSNGKVSGVSISGVFFQGLGNMDFCFRLEGEIQGFDVSGCNFRNFNTAVFSNAANCIRSRFGANGYDVGVTEIFGGPNSALGFDSSSQVQIELGDNSVISLTPPKMAQGESVVGKIEVWVRRQPGEGGAVLYDSQGGAAGVVNLYNTANFESTTGVLTGTTGTDGAITVSAHTDGMVYIENRLGQSNEIIYSFCEPWNA